MAGFWIKMETNLSEKPEVLLMADELEIDEDTVVGKLHRLWSWFDNNSDDGTTRLSIRFLDKIVRLDGFATAMISSGWMIESEGTLSLANWESHNGETAKRRAKESKRKGQKRLQNKGSDEPVRKVSAKTRTKSGQVSANARTKCGTEQSRVEKNRAEEKKEPPKPPQGDDSAFPDGLDRSFLTDEFKSTWDDWITHRKQKRSKLTPMAIRKQVKKMNDIGPDRSIRALNHSITNGWSGIFEPSDRGDSRNDSGESVSDKAIAELNTKGFFDDE